MIFIIMISIMAAVCNAIRDTSHLPEGKVFLPIMLHEFISIVVIILALIVGNWIKCL
jgi:hypothetical protein